MEALTQEGHILEYANTVNGRELTQGGVVAAWWPTRERDRLGNDIRVSYHNDVEDNATKEIVPDRIEYGVPPGSPNARAVVFARFEASQPRF